LILIFDFLPRGVSAVAAVAVFLSPSHLSFVSKLVPILGSLNLFLERAESESVPSLSSLSSISTTLRDKLLQSLLSFACSFQLSPIEMPSCVCVRERERERERDDDEEREE
jgi:hypothetical protein